MRILAIDPGNEESAWCMLDGRRPVLFGKRANQHIVDHVRHTWQFDLLAIEMIASYGMAVGREVFDTCLWVGRFVQAGERPTRPHKLIYRKDVKLYLCNSTRATDANIRAALIDRYGPGKDRAIGTKKAPGPLYGLKGDEWSALAIALTAARTPDEAVRAVLGNEVMA